jgi:predicted nuclease with TOPRIM domain
MLQPESPKTQETILEVFDDLKKTREKLQNHIQELVNQNDNTRNMMNDLNETLNNLQVTEIPRSYMGNYREKLSKYSPEVQKYILDLNDLQQQSNSISKDIELSKEVFDSLSNGFNIIARQAEVKILGGNSNTSISELCVGMRTFRLLQTNDINTFGDLKQKSDQELLSIQGFGEKLLNELKEGKIKFPYFLC